MPTDKESAVALGRLLTLAAVATALARGPGRGRSLSGGIFRVTIARLFPPTLLLLVVAWASNGRRPREAARVRRTEGKWLQLGYHPPVPESRRNEGRGCGPQSLVGGHSLSPAPFPQPGPISRGGAKVRTSVKVKGECRDKPVNSGDTKNNEISGLDAWTPPTAMQGYPDMRTRWAVGHPTGSTWAACL